MSRRRLSFRVSFAIAALLLLSAEARAQEDLEPRTVGGTGDMSIGLSGFIDRFGSNEESFPLRATLHVDVSRFVSGRVAVRAGLVGSTFFGESEGETPTGPQAAALHGHGDVLFYFTPQSMMSVYTGAEYRAQLTHRADKDAGTVLGLAGLQATVSSRASVFVQGGYGVRLTRGDEGELQSRIVGELGLRIRF
jgi:hypothetical protein